MNKQPSLIKILTIDYFAFMACLIPIVIWGFYFVFMNMQKVDPGDYTLPLIFGAATLIALAVIAWRVREILSIFDDGLEAQAVIGNVFFFRDRGRVDYSYTFQGQNYIGGNALHKVKQTQALAAGQHVTVMVDRNNPKNAYIRDLYL
jgi:hypothetical protein